MPFTGQNCLFDVLTSFPSQTKKEEKAKERKKKYTKNRKGSLSVRKVSYLHVDN